MPPLFWPLTFIFTVLATIPSTMFSVNGSKGLSVLRMNSGFRRYPLRLLYSNIPIFSCMGRSTRAGDRTFTHMTSFNDTRN